MEYEYIVSWYGTKQVETPSCYSGVYNTELCGQYGSDIFKQDHSLCEDDYYKWRTNIQIKNELYTTPAIISVSEIEAG